MPAKPKASKRKPASKTAPTTNPEPAATDASALESLVGGVQQRFSDLVSWHQQQAQALENDKAQLYAEQEATRAELDRERDAQARARTDLDDRDTALTAKEQAVADREKAALADRKSLDADHARLRSDRDALELAQEQLEAAQAALEAERAELQELGGRLHREHEELRVEWDTAHAVRRAQDQLFELVETERHRVDHHLQRLIQSTVNTDADTPPLTLRRPDEQTPDAPAQADAA